MKIRGRTDLTEARDELVARLKAFIPELEACRGISDLDHLIWSLKALRVDEAVADLANALEIGAKPNTQAPEPEAKTDDETGVAIPSADTTAKD